MPYMGRMVGLQTGGFFVMFFEPCIGFALNASTNIWNCPTHNERKFLVAKLCFNVTTTLENATNKWLAAMHIIKIQKTKTWNMWNAHAFSVAKRSLPSKAKKKTQNARRKKQKLTHAYTKMMSLVSWMLSPNGPSKPKPLGLIPSPCSDSGQNMQA